MTTESGSDSEARPEQEAEPREAGGEERRAQEVLAAAPGSPAPEQVSGRFPRPRALGLWAGGELWARGRRPLWAQQGRLLYVKASSEWPSTPWPAVPSSDEST